MELVLFLEPRSWSVKNLGESLINCGVVGLIVNVAPIIEYTVTVSVGTMGRVFYMSRIPVVVGYTVMMEERPTVAPALSWVESGSSQRCYSPSGCSILISTTGSDLRFWRTVTVFLAKMREMVICHFLDDGPTVNHEEATPPRNDHRSASGSQASVRTHADDLVAEVLVRLFAALASVAPSSDFKAPTLVTAAPTMATESLAKVTPTTSPAVRVTTLAKPSADTMSTSARSKKTGGLMKLAH